MKWQSSTLVMFIGSIVLGFFIISSLLVNRTSDIQCSLSKFYQAVWMALWMVLLELAMFPNAPSTMYLGTVLLIVMVFYLARRQVGIGDKDYLKAMIQHHSSAILTSDRILEKSQDEKVRKLAEWISRSQQDEITFMNQLLNTM